MIKIHNPEKSQGRRLENLLDVNDIVLVEGEDDASVTQLLLNGILDSALIYVAGGESKFEETVELLKTLRGFPGIGSLSIIRDANGDPEAKSTSCKRIFASQGLDVPIGPMLPTNGRPRTGFLLMPSDGTGSLESVLLDAYPDTMHPAHAHTFVSAIDHDDIQAEAWTPGQGPKRLLRALLGVGSKQLCIKINTVVPSAVKRGLWRVDHPGFAAYRTYFASIARSETE